MTIEIKFSGQLGRGSHVSEWRYRTGLPRGTVEMPFEELKSPSGAGEPSTLNHEGEEVSWRVGDRLIIGVVQHKDELKCEYAIVMGLEPKRGDDPYYDALIDRTIRSPRLSQGEYFQRQWLDPDQFIISR